MSVLRGKNRQTDRQTENKHSFSKASLLCFFVVVNSGRSDQLPENTRIIFSYKALDVNLQPYTSIHLWRFRLASAVSEKIDEPQC